MDSVAETIINPAVLEGLWITGIGQIMFDGTKGIMPQEQNNLNYFKNAGYSPRLVSSSSALSYIISQGINKTDLKLKTDPELISQTILGLLQKK